MSLAGKIQMLLFGFTFSESELDLIGSGAKVGKVGKVPLHPGQGG